MSDTQSSDRYDRLRNTARHRRITTAATPESDEPYRAVQSHRPENGIGESVEDNQRGIAMLMSLATEVTSNSPPLDEISRAGIKRQGRIRSIPLALVVILIAQAALSLRLLPTNTASTDEALYLWAGHLEWAHWLHGIALPLFPTYFSGAPVVYPPLGALADSIGGLAGARVLSACISEGLRSSLAAHRYPVPSPRSPERDLAVDCQHRQ